MTFPDTSLRVYGRQTRKVAFLHKIVNYDSYSHLLLKNSEQSVHSRISGFRRNPFPALHRKKIFNCPMKYWEVFLEFWCCELPGTFSCLWTPTEVSFTGSAQEGADRLDENIPQVLSQLAFSCWWLLSFPSPIAMPLTSLCHFIWSF